MLLKSCVLLLTVAVHGSQSAYKVEPYSTGAYSLGEGPHWDYKTNTLYFVDAFVGDFYHLDDHMSRRQLDKYSLKDLITIVIPYADSDHHLLVSVRNKVVKYDTTTRTVAPVAEIAPELQGKERFNDGKTDAMGRLWIGSVLDGPSGAVPGKGSLYKLEHGKFVKIATGFTLSNGLAWSLDNSRLYFNDSEDRKIYVFDFDLKNGTVKNKRVFVDLKSNPDFKSTEVSDGMTVDKSGKLWVGLYAGGRVVRINTDTGKVEQSIPVPALLTTTPAFGGEALDQMFVTTGKDGQDLKKYPNAGKVFRITSDDPGTVASTIGDGPHWDYKTNTLYFTDSFTRNFYHEDDHLSPRKLDKYSAADLVTIAIPYEDSDHHLLVSVRNKLVKYDTTTRTAAPVAELKQRFNDGKADAMGRLWIGTMADENKGGLYKLEHGRLEQMATGFTLANGLAWSPDNTRLYLIDSGDLKIYVFDFDLKNGTATNIRVFVNLNKNPDFPDVVMPDGMTVDKSGNLWVGLFTAGRVVKINPETARVEQSIPVPALFTTTPIFGGESLDQMFVTTGMLGQNMTQYPNAGKVFRITSDEPGFRGSRHASHFNPNI
ncbi:unnamed protein product [Medioppia subpectinata]|uniref:SMP-30/Gluconolactonase/LRE-like region domain-containing protein n=1 Tax=Medioppia subpectinata TaxID=1979941 RepID=A0A7R9KJ62_9ACAR|nr:unnamed protein product [Medioppia subpectinata]CAG2103299.1 unnamed protein product [Medioppia subpectinata]